MADVRDVQVVWAAANAWLAATDGFPDERPADVPTRLRLAAAWLDFYDATFEVVERAIGCTEPFWQFPRDDLQADLRSLADDLAPPDPNGEETTDG